MCMTGYVKMMDFPRIAIYGHSIRFPDVGWYDNFSPPHCISMYVHVNSCL